MKLNKKILIAEDDMTSRTMLQAVLTKWGYAVTAASDGEEAWTALQEQDAPGLVLLDWEMPGIDGANLCRRLRDQDRKAPLYLILLTSRGEPDDIVQGLEAGADDYIAKPYNTTELKARVGVGYRLLMLQNEMREREKLQGVLEMAGAVCHELNQPLQVVSGFSEMLLLDVDADETNYEALKAIKKNVDRIGELTGKIMRITRYQAKSYLNGQIVDIDQASDWTISQDIALTDSVSFGTEIENGTIDNKKSFSDRYSILLAEDDKMNQIFVTGLIKNLDLGQVQIACNGKEAVKMFNSGSFDLILMDGQMPDMNGIDATREIRLLEKKHQLPKIPIIALTAHGEEQDKERFLASGMDEFITKPVSSDVLKAAIQKVTRGPSADVVSSQNNKHSQELTETIDLTELREIMTENKSLLKKCLHTFISSYQSQIIQIGKSLDDNEYERLKKDAHRLKGMLKYLAARNGIKLTEQLESIAVGRNTKGAERIVRALNEECLKVIDSIKMILEGDSF